MIINRNNDKQAENKPKQRVRIQHTNNKNHINTKTVIIKHILLLMIK